MTLDTKTKELVAVGSSIAANCQPCLKYHLKIAKDSGATEEEIKDAMEIAGFVKSKSAVVQEKSAEGSKVCCG